MVARLLQAGATVPQDLLHFINCEHVARDMFPTISDFERVVRRTVEAAGAPRELELAQTSNCEK